MENPARKVYKFIEKKVDGLLLYSPVDAETLKLANIMNENSLDDVFPIVTRKQLIILKNAGLKIEVKK